MSTTETAPLDPIVRQALEGMPPFDASSPAAARAWLRAIATSAGAEELGVNSSDHQFRTEFGHPIALRVYRSSSRDPEVPLPVVLYCHGGGFAMGDIDSYDAVCSRHAAGLDAIVVYFDYRLAPEHPYPAAVEDGWSTLRWVADHARELGGDSRRLAVAGDSAGGNLAAVLAQLARDNGGPELAFQLLWYPTTTLDFSLPSFQENADAPILDIPTLEKLVSWYAADVDPTDPPATLAPSRAATFAGLAPAFIGISGHDPLRDDGAQYADLLSAAGVSVDLHHAPTLPHGYVYFAGAVPAAAEAFAAGIRSLGKALHD